MTDVSLFLEMLGTSMSAPQWRERWDWIEFSLRDLSRCMSTSQVDYDSYRKLVLDFEYEPRTMWTLVKVSIGLK